MGSSAIKSKHIGVQVSKENLEHFKECLWEPLAELLDSTGRNEVEVGGKEILRMLENAPRESKSGRPDCSLNKYSMFRIFYMVLINNGAHVYMPGRPPVALTYVRLQDLGIKKDYKVIISDDDEGKIRRLFEKTEKLVSQNMGVRKAVTQTEYSDDATFATDNHEIFTENRARSIIEVNLKDINDIPEGSGEVEGFEESLFDGVKQFLRQSQKKAGRNKAFYDGKKLCFKIRECRSPDEINGEIQVGCFPVRSKLEIKHALSNNRRQMLQGEDAASEIMKIANDGKPNLCRWFLFHLMHRDFSVTMTNGDSLKWLCVDAEDLNTAPALLIEKTPVIFVRKDLCYRLRKTEDEEKLYLERIGYQQVREYIREAPRVRFLDPPGGKDRYIDISLCQWT